MKRRLSRNRVTSDALTSNAAWSKHSPRQPLSLYIDSYTICLNIVMFICISMMNYVLWVVYFLDKGETDK